MAATYPQYGVCMGQFTFEGKQAIEKTVSERGSSGVVYLPKDWIGKNVVVILEGK